MNLVVFRLEEQKYALGLEAVERVFPAVEWTPLPKAPEIVLGVVNVQGRIVPVFNLRRRFRLPEREVQVEDRMILASARKRSVALLVDEVSGVIERPEREVIEGEKILPGLEYVQGVAKLDDGLVLIHDLDRFLSLEEQEALEAGLRERHE